MFPWVQKEWPLDLYRRRSSGWEKQIPAGTANSHHLQPNATGKPMRGCVAIKRYRLKISLDGDKAGRMEIIRRNKCMLFCPKSNRHAHILLQFPTLKDCLEFSDELMFLNRSLYASKKETGSSPKTTEKSTPGAKKTVLRGGGQKPPPGPPAPGVQRNQMYCHIVRLVQDEGFLAFTAKVEDLIKSSPDGNKILEALERGDHEENKEN